MRRLRVETMGDDLVVRLPAELVAELGIREGDGIEVAAARRALSEAERARQRQAAVARMAERRLHLPESFRFDRDEANER